MPQPTIRVACAYFLYFALPFCTTLVARRKLKPPRSQPRNPVDIFIDELSTQTPPFPHNGPTCGNDSNPAISDYYTIGKYSNHVELNGTFITRSIRSTLRGYCGAFLTSKSNWTAETPSAELAESRLLGTPREFDEGRGI